MRECVSSGLLTLINDWIEIYLTSNTLLIGQVANKQAGPELGQAGIGLYFNFQDLVILDLVWYNWLSLQVLLPSSVPDGSQI